MDFKVKIFLIVALLCLCPPFGCGDDDDDDSGPADDDDDTAIDDDDDDNIDDDDDDDTVDDDDDTTDDDDDNTEGSGFLMELVDGGDPGFNGSDHAYGPDGAVVVATIAGGLALYRYDGTNVERELILPFGISPSVIVGQDGAVHVACHDQYTGHLFYATDQGGSWQSLEIDSNTFENSMPDIGIDSQGKIYIAYYFASSGNQLRMATNATGAWKWEIVDNTGFVGAYPSIAIDASDIPHIAYRDLSFNTLKYAEKSSGSWNIEEVDSTTGAGVYNSLALDAQGHAHISHYHAGNSSLKYATNATGGWVSDFVEPFLGSGDHSTIAVDANGFAHIAYQTTNIASLKYATNASGTWKKDSVELLGGYYLKEISICMDSSGKPSIAYTTDTQGLKLAVANGANWVKQVLDDGGARGGFASLVIDGKGREQVSYWDFNNSDLIYAIRDKGQWTRQVVDAFGYIGPYNSLDVDANDNPHIAYYNDSNGNLKYAKNEGGGWLLETVDFLGDVGEHCSMALDPSGFAHIAYYDYNNYEMRYATNYGGNWSTAVIDNAYAGWLTSIDVDGDGWTHIGYYSMGYNSVKYAENIFGSWATSTIDYAINDIEAVNLKVDDQNLPHIVFNMDGALYYASLAGGWNLEPVEPLPGTGVGNYASLAIDSYGYAYIAYQDSNLEQLKYATNRDGNWHTTNLTENGSMGLYTSIAIENDTHVHIVFQGEKALYHVVFPANYF